MIKSTYFKSAHADIVLLTSRALDITGVGTRCANFQGVLN